VCTQGVASLSGRQQRQVLQAQAAIMSAVQALVSRQKYHRRRRRVINDLCLVAELCVPSGGHLQTEASPRVLRAMVREE
jgi:hypothetical protein